VIEKSLDGRKLLVGDPVVWDLSEILWGMFPGRAVIADVVADDDGTLVVDIEFFVPSVFGLPMLSPMDCLPGMFGRFKSMCMSASFTKT
jgi:hypothetical protein